MGSALKEPAITECRWPLACHVGCLLCAALTGRQTFEMSPEPAPPVMPAPVDDFPWDLDG